MLLELRTRRAAPEEDGLNSLRLAGFLRESDTAIGFSHGFEMWSTACHDSVGSIQAHLTNMENPV
jgi:hypothetical protein